MNAGLVLSAIVLATAVGAAVNVEVGATAAPASSASVALRLPVEGSMPSLTGATGWLNSLPLDISGLRGKVVLIDVWTFTCINWMRTLPYVRAWAEKYQRQGLVVIGVHSPEFSFEHDVAKVTRAVKALNVDFPVALDGNFAIWHALDNRYWPALYLVDAQGRIRYHQFGEGNYAESELAIQQLLADAGARDVGPTLVSVTGRGAEAAPDAASLKSAETYVGYERAENFSSPGVAAVDRSRVYSAPPRLRLNHWALAGDWTVTGQAALLNKPGGRITYCFHARDLHLVMGSGVRGTPVRFRVRIDGKPPGTAHGADVDEQGLGTVSEQRLYQLIRQDRPITDRLFEIEFLDPGAEAYSFTFG